MADRTNTYTPQSQLEEMSEIAESVLMTFEDQATSAVNQRFFRSTHTFEMTDFPDGSWVLTVYIHSMSWNGKRWLVAPMAVCKRVNS